ncbi:MAG: nucleotidyl transferase AbiEii/AbiGii toxin family protein [Oligoflexia bacterium]|nr:nucleotidyl transferase AbiEii/AbiGii toxin family protein [Oligoflexia bacterium]
MAKTQIKFEIVLEARIELERPGPKDRICGVVTLAALDMAAIKLLANSDRWSDDSVFSRDLIDLAMLEPSRPLLTRAIAKAAAAYGESIERDLGRAVQRLGERPGRLDECMAALNINGLPKALLWIRIRRLRPTERR